MRPRVAAALAVATLAAVAAHAGAAPAQAPECTDAELGVLAPLSGDASFLGKEQLSWTRYAVSVYNKQFETRFSVREADSELSAASARAAARTLVTEPRVLGVVGGATSGAVVASAPLFAKASLASVSGSATGRDLTTRGLTSFFRVVPHDGLQAPSIADVITGRLRAKRVLVAADRDPHSSSLATEIAKLLAGAGVAVDRAAPEAVVAKVTAATDLVVYATGDARAANDLAEQLSKAGKRARLFATDAYSPGQFAPRAGYVSSFADDLRFRSSAKAVRDGYRSFSRGRSFGTFGPPSYDAAWVLASAIDRACGDGRATRTEVLTQVRTTNVPSILGGRIRFTPRGEPVGARFAVFKVTNGTYRRLA